MTTARNTTTTASEPVPLYMQPLREPTPAALAAIAAFIPEFEAPDASAGEWMGGDRRAEGGTISFPWFQLSPLMRRFEDAAYENGFVSVDFPWATWRYSWGVVYFKDIEMVPYWPAPVLPKMLTTIFRAERICEGTVAAEFKSGMLLAIARGADRLHKQSLGGTSGGFLGGRSQKHRR